jgi:hypothetical protein
MGYAFGFLTRMLLRLMRRFGAGREQEVALTVAMVRTWGGFGRVFVRMCLALCVGRVCATSSMPCLSFSPYSRPPRPQAYLAYWVTASPCKGSGVVAVAVMGLYGAAKNKW